MEKMEYNDLENDFDEKLTLTEKCKLFYYSLHKIRNKQQIEE